MDRTKEYTELSRNKAKIDLEASSLNSNFINIWDAMPAAKREKKQYSYLLWDALLDAVG